MNQNSLSGMSVNYIGYFYHVFPLHLNSFNKLFYNQLSRYTQIMQQNIRILFLDLYLIRGMKFKLDRSTSDTLKFLDFLNNHLNIYKKPHDNLKSFVDSFVQILIYSIDHDVESLTNLLSHLNIFNHHSLNELRLSSNISYYLNDYLSGIRGTGNGTKIKKFLTDIVPLPYFIKNSKDANIGNYYYFIEQKNTKSIKGIKGELESFKGSLRSTSSSTPDYISKIKEKLRDITSNYLKITPINNIEKLDPITFGRDNLTKLNQKLKESLNAIRKDKRWIENQISDLNKYKYLKKYAKENYSGQKGFDSLMKFFQKDEENFKSNKKKIEMAEKIVQFLKATESRIGFLTGYIPNLTRKLSGAKSSLDKLKLIEYIINLIDTVNLIISVEPSQIVESLKPIYSLKPELESIINSIKVTDIQTDIQNLQNLKSQIVNIQSLPRNMSKLKEYTASVESHLGGIDTILKSLTNVENLINSTYLRLILSESGLEEFYRNHYESKLNEKDPVRKYMDQIKHYIFILNYLVRMINGNINKIQALVNDLRKAVEHANNETKGLKSDIVDVECVIEGVVINFIKCSIKQVSNHLIDQFIHSHSHISEPLISLYNYSQKLQIDFNLLSKFLPSESMIHPFIIQLKEILDTVISKFDLTTTTYIISRNLYKIIYKFNEDFKSLSNEISDKLKKHIEQIESIIKSIQNETKGSVKIITSKIGEINIDELISNLDQNNRSLSKFDGYKRERDLIKLGIPFEPNDLINLGPIYLPLKLYKRRMISYSSIQTNLSELKTKLTVIENIIEQICQKITEYESNLPDLEQIDLQIYLLQYLKIFFIKWLKAHIPYFYSLEKIGEHISSLKSFSNSLKDKLDDQFTEAVNELKPIDIKTTYRDIYSKVENIKKQIEQIISFLELIKLLLQYRDSLKIMLLPLSSCYIKNNVCDFLKNSRTIVQTLREASKTIETTTQEIEELKKNHGYLSKHVPGDLETTFKNDISPIPQFIKEVSVYLRIVRYIIYELHIIKSNSINIIKEIKGKIEQIKDVDTALTNLKEIYSDIIIQYIILWVLLC